MFVAQSLSQRMIYIRTGGFIGYLPLHFFVLTDILASRKNIFLAIGGVRKEKMYVDLKPPGDLKQSRQRGNDLLVFDL